MENQKKTGSQQQKKYAQELEIYNTNKHPLHSIHHFFFSPSFPEGALTPPATPREAEEATGPGSGVLLQDSKKDFGVAKLYH